MGHNYEVEQHCIVTAVELKNMCNHLFSCFVVRLGLYHWLLQFNLRAGKGHWRQPEMDSDKLEWIEK